MTRPREKRSLPADWQPCQELIDYARDRGFDDPAIELMVERFKNYYSDAVGVRSKHKNWKGTFKNWCLSEASRRNVAPARKVSIFETLIELEGRQ